MSKAILVLDDMPFGCRDCKLHIGITDFAGIDAGCYCLATGLTNHDGANRGARCPLKEMPEKLTNASDKLDEMAKGNIIPSSVGFDWSDMIYENGWNNCIDQILMEGTNGKTDA